TGQACPHRRRQKTPDHPQRHAPRRKTLHQLDPATNTVAGLRRDHGLVVFGFAYSAAACFGSTAAEYASISVSQALPGVKRYSATSDTGVTSAAVPVRKHSSKSAS